MDTSKFRTTNRTNLGLKDGDWLKTGDLIMGPFYRWFAEKSNNGWFIRHNTHPILVRDAVEAAYILGYTQAMRDFKRKGD